MDSGQGQSFLAIALGSRLKEQPPSEMLPFMQPSNKGRRWDQETLAWILHVLFPPALHWLKQITWTSPRSVGSKMPLPQGGAISGRSSNILNIIHSTPGGRLGWSRSTKYCGFVCVFVCVCELKTPSLKHCPPLEAGFYSVSLPQG